MKLNPTLKELRREIGYESQWVDRKEHSAKLITLSLRMIDQYYGVDEANRAIDDYKLEKLGWRKK